MRTTRFAVIPGGLFSFPRAQYARSRERLLATASQHTGRTYDRPRDALQDIIRLHGWQMARRPLPGRDWGQLDPSSKTVWVCLRIREKMDFPQSENEAIAFTMAHELAHLRLHLPTILAGRMAPAHEKEADAWAGVFLLPENQLRARPEFQSLDPSWPSDRIWEQAGALGKHFGVSASATVRELQALGAVERLSGTRTLRVRPAFDSGSGSGCSYDLSRFGSVDR